MRGGYIAFSVQLVQVFGSRRTGGNPAVVGGHFDAAYGKLSIRGFRAFRRDRFTAKRYVFNVRSSYGGNAALFFFGNRRIAS